MWERKMEDGEEDEARRRRWRMERKNKIEEGE